MENEIYENYHVPKISRLLQPFIDIGTELRVTPIFGGDFEVSGTRSFQDFKFQLRPVNSFEQYVVIRKQEETLANYLSGPRFGKLKDLARSMLQHLKQQIHAQPIVDGRLIAVSDSEEILRRLGERNLATQSALQCALTSRPIGQTHLLFLHADAGGGKSWALINSAIQQAQMFLSSNASSLFLYVDAQGANLRSLEQQISYQLDLYNGILRFAEIVPLIQLGVISLIVDGFDELIMPSGYNDTLSALSSYLEALEGTGSVLASARSAFFHTYDLETAGVKMSFPICQTILELQPWSTVERKSLCDKLGRQHLFNPLEMIAQQSGSPIELIGRPFVVAEILRLLEAGNGLANDEIMFAIENAFLERERQEKILDQHGEPILDGDQFRDLIMEISLEMWRLRQTILDGETLKIIVGLVAEKWGLRIEERELLIQRIEINPILVLTKITDSRSKTVRFPHEVLFSRFLARAVLKAIVVAPAEAVSLLREAPLSNSTLEQVSLIATLGEKAVFGFPLEGPDSVLSKISKLCESVSNRPENRNVRLNFGSLVGALLPCRKSTASLILNGLVFEKVQFRGAKLRGISFSHCDFEDVDGRRTDWQECQFIDCPPIQKISLDRLQRLPASAPDVVWLVVDDGCGGTEDYFGKGQTLPVLFPERYPSGPPPTPDLGVSDLAKTLSELAVKVARRGLRTFWISIEDTDSGDKGLRMMRRDPNWPVIIDLLERHGLAYRSVRQRRGSNPEMLHVVSPQQIILGSDRSATELSDKVSAFWDYIRAR